MTADEILFRCSSLGHLISQSERGGITKEVRTHLIDKYTSAVYGRNDYTENRYTEKGNAREQDALTLVSVLRRKEYRKNTVRLSNKFITGEPDTYEGESIYNAERTLDTKCSYSVFTYFRAVHGSLDEMYYWQGQGYMALTGAQEHIICYCLLNNTADAIAREIHYLQYKNLSQENYIDEMRNIERNNIFDLNEFITENPDYPLVSSFDRVGDKYVWDYDIPRKQRLHQIPIKRNDEQIERLYQRITDCRTWMNQHLLK